MSTFFHLFFSLQQALLSSPKGLVLWPLLALWPRWNHTRTSICSHRPFTTCSLCFINCNFCRWKSSPVMWSVLAHTSFRGLRKIFRHMNSLNLLFCDYFLKVRVEKKSFFKLRILFFILIISKFFKEIYIDLIL